MDSIGASIETEQRAKGEALRVKKQLEGEINELEIGLDHANKANSEGLKSIKRYQGQLRETIQLFEDEAPNVLMKFTAPKIDLTPAKCREKIAKSTDPPAWATFMIEEDKLFNQSPLLFLQVT